MHTVIYYICRTVRMILSLAGNVNYEIKRTSYEWYKNPFQCIVAAYHDIILGYIPFSPDTA